uniref:Uncharacterized protein n=1 Tax=Romanomermis culicivorax TaxID=13658 RepID=A0A915KGD0_ROMCU
MFIIVNISETYDIQHQNRISLNFLITFDVLSGKLTSTNCSNPEPTEMPDNRGNCSDKATLSDRVLCARFLLSLNPFALNLQPSFGYIERIHKYDTSYEKQVKCGFPTSKAALGYTHCLRRNRNSYSKNQLIVKSGKIILDYSKNESFRIAFIFLDSLKTYDDEVER